jgi:hypothetical protein
MLLGEDSVIENVSRSEGTTEIIFECHTSKLRVTICKAVIFACITHVSID